MRKPIYANSLHKQIIEKYIYTIKDFVNEASTKKKYEQFLEVLDIIIEYHNTYGNNVKVSNWYDWLMLLPINLTVATNGFFAGLETKSNSIKLNSYRTVLNEMLQEMINKIEKFENIND